MWSFWPFTGLHHLVYLSCGCASVLEKRFVTFPFILPAQLEPSRWIALSLFHAVTGCDAVSHVLGCGRKTAWSAWQITTGLIGTLVALSSDPQQLSLQSQHMQTLERFVVVMYSKGCGLSRVNETRLRLFTSGKKTLEALPPTQAALYQHIRRAVLQAIIWNQATSVLMDIPDFKDWGWHKDNSGRWLPLWITPEDSSKACSILLQCYCVKSCRGNCKCSKAGVHCTGLCKCEWGCVNSEDDSFIYWYIDWLTIVIIVLISCFLYDMLSKGSNSCLHYLC